MKILVIGNDNATINAGRLLGEVRAISSDSATDIMAKYVASLAGVTSEYSHIIAPHNSYGREVMAYLSGILQMPLCSNIVEIIDAESFKRPIYAGEFTETIRNDAAIKLLTISPSSFDNTALI